jgi:hypothetical protein
VAAEFIALACASFSGVHADILGNDGIDGMSSGQAAISRKKVCPQRLKPHSSQRRYRSAKALRHPKSAIR